MQLLIENQSETQNGRNGETKITALNLIDEADINGADLLHVVDDPSGTPVNKKLTIERLFNNIPSFLALDDIESLDESTSVSSGISEGV